MSENDAPSVPVPDYRPVERFWPYIDLPEQPSNEELARLNPELAEALFGRAPLPFSISIEFPTFEGPEFERALSLARASAEYLEVRDGSHRAASRAVLPARRRQAPRPVRAGRALRRDRRPRRRPASPVRAGAVAAPALVPDHVTSADVPHGRTDRPAEGPCDPRRGHQASRGGIQHVLRRPAAAAAVGDARSGRGADQASRPRLHHQYRPIASASRCCSRASRR